MQTLYAKKNIQNILWKKLGLNVDRI